MTFSRKIFISVFLTSLLLGSGLVWVAHRYVSKQSTDEFVNRYLSFSAVLGSTLSRLDTQTEALMLNAVKVIAEKDKAKGVLSTQELKALRDELNVTHIFVTDKGGNFIRSTNEDPRLIPNAFSFCPDYKDLIRGRDKSAATPIIFPQPEPKPYKFLFIPSHNRERLLEVGVRVDFVAKTLTEALGSDSSVQSLALFAPDGSSFGRFKSGEIEFNGQRIDPPKTFPSIADEGDRLKIYTKVTSSHPSCCQCDVSGTSKNGEYYYILESEISKQELKAIQATTKNIFLFLAYANIALAFLLSWIISRKLVRNIEKAVSKVRKIKSHGGFADRIGLNGKDEVAFLTQEFDHLLDSLEVSQRRMIEAEKTQVKIQMAKEVAHNIRSPIVAIEMMLPMLVKVPEKLQKVLKDSVKEIKALSSRLQKMSSETQSFTENECAPVEISKLIETLLDEKRIEFSNHLGIEFRFEDQSLSSEVQVLADSVELKSVLSNLINNAVQSYPGKCGKVEIAVSESKGRCHIQVLDFGVGISENLKQKLGYEPVTIKADGNGIGVFHAKRKLASWGGTLEISSEIGNGTSVIIKLPCFSKRQVHTLAQM